MATINAGPTDRHFGYIPESHQTQALLSVKTQ